MRPQLAAVLLTSTLVGGGLAVAETQPPGLTPSVGTPSASVGDRSVDLSWPAVEFNGTHDDAVVVLRDGAAVATLPATATSWSDSAVAPGEHHGYQVEGTGSYGGDNHQVSATSAVVSVSLPAYLVGAQANDISPDLIGLGTINQGGFGVGDGTGTISQDDIDTPFGPQSNPLGRGGQNQARSDRIKARAVVFDDGKQAIAITTIETQGYFAAYRGDLAGLGLSDMAAAASNARMPASSILIASDHTHGGPDTVGVWGSVPRAYYKFIYDRTVAAIRQAYDNRRFAVVTAGHSDASDLIYNQGCAEALYQSEGDVPAPFQDQHKAPCPTGSLQGSEGKDGKDGLVRVVQARTPAGATVVTYMAYAAHATAGGGDGIHGDWPQYVGDAMAARFGGVGMAMEGAVGTTQPCRPACAFSAKTNPSFHTPGGRKAEITANYMAHVVDAVSHSAQVRGPVAAAKGYIREQVTGPAVVALFTAGGAGLGAHLRRSISSPWMVGETIRTVVAALRVGDVLFAGTPGEGYPAIAFGVRDALSGPREVVALGLANDQLGYLIAPAPYYAPVTAEAAVNDNTIFNVSPTIGDHVMCADIRLAKSIGFAATADPANNARLTAYCAAYDAIDAAGDPLGSVPVGGVSLDDPPTP
ncbi:MAG: hypothetical protein QOK42_193 [Frankiaceae bacterium]|jgi:hypothetical protein|nr:hypothetical protein [Frankiaceae bacterium]MDX6275733.1 hypothetical protein [Frankiales bacterium]